jgi:unsaturated rhamnogalacturonyl hydrolase
MALPFLTEYATVSGELSVMEDVLNQVKNIVSIMRDENSGLYFHAYDESLSMFWADPVTGLSREIWLRAMGWFCAALADICGLSENYPPLHDFCADTLADALNALSGCITAENMLLQLPAKPLYPDNYPETSGSLLFAYSALKAYRLGICSDKIKADGTNVLSAVAENFISIDDNDIPVMKNICLMAGLGGEKKRDGSAEYYLSEPVVENDAKGIAPFLMAVAEVARG